MELTVPIGTRLKVTQTPLVQFRVTTSRTSVHCTASRLGAAVADCHAEGRSLML